MNAPQGEPFWFVWNPQGRQPTFRHRNVGCAVAEAERLARLNPGETFIVLESVCSRCVNDMQRVDLRPDLDIPF